MSVEMIKLWHDRACPTPDARAFDVQLGCHFEEIVEMLDVLDINSQDTLHRARAALSWIAAGLKNGQLKARITDRKEFLDAAADQIVTATGAAYRAGMDISEAVHRVNRSNWSKYVDGMPVFDDNGKIKKGPDYAPPNLEGLY